MAPGVSPGVFYSSTILMLALPPDAARPAVEQSFYDDPLFHRNPPFYHFYCCLDRMPKEIYDIIYHESFRDLSPSELQPIYRNEEFSAIVYSNFRRTYLPHFSKSLEGAEIMTFMKDVSSSEEIYQRTAPSPTALPTATITSIWRGQGRQLRILMSTSSRNDKQEALYGPRMQRFILKDADWQIFAHDESSKVEGDFCLDEAASFINGRFSHWTRDFEGLGHWTRRNNEYVESERRSKGRRCLSQNAADLKLSGMQLQRTAGAIVTVVQLCYPGLRRPEDQVVLGSWSHSAVGRSYSTAQQSSHQLVSVLLNLNDEIDGVKAGRVTTSLNEQLKGRSKEGSSAWLCQPDLRNVGFRAPHTDNTEASRVTLGDHLEEMSARRETRVRAANKQTGYVPILLNSSGYGIPRGLRRE
ncbi:hypothetical protein BDZ89DRAFT_1052227 [Hymenopellis radicata]|nr:hypothetical protein BDZ89DRAFT_1052227 [Hymenopellis radicata]